MYRCRRAAPSDGVESHFPSFNLSQGRLREELHNALMDQAVEMESAAKYDLELSSLFDEVQRKNKEFVRSVREQRASRYVWFRPILFPSSFYWVVHVTLGCLITLYRGVELPSFSKHPSFPS